MTAMLLFSISLLFKSVFYWAGILYNISPYYIQPPRDFDILPKPWRKSKLWAKQQRATCCSTVQDCMDVPNRGQSLPNSCWQTIIAWFCNFLYWKYNLFCGCAPWRKSFKSEWKLTTFIQDGALRLQLRFYFWQLQSNLAGFEGYTILLNGQLPKEKRFFREAFDEGMLNACLDDKGSIEHQ